MYIRLHVKYPFLYSDFNETLNFLGRFPEKSPNIKFYKDPPSASRVVSCGQTDGQTGMSY